MFYNRGEPYFEFTNFAAYPIHLDGEQWPTTEHYFQAQKFIGTPYLKYIGTLQTPRDAFSLSRESQVSQWLRSDWEQVKQDIMYKALLAKFSQHSNLRAMLLGTGEKKLIEHTSNDSYWGDGGNGTGQNHLGRLLMKVRSELSKVPDEHNPYSQIDQSPHTASNEAIRSGGNSATSLDTFSNGQHTKYTPKGSLGRVVPPLDRNGSVDVHVADTNSQLLLDAKESTGTEKLNGLPVTYITTDMDASHGIDQFFKLANTANHSTDTTEKLSSTITSNTLLHANSSHNDDVTKSHDTNYHPQLEAGTEILDDLLATNESSDTDTSRGLLASDIHQSPDATALTNPLDAVGLSNVNTESLDSERVKQSTDATTCKQTPHTNTSKRLLAANILPGVDTSNWSQNINPLLDSSASLRSIDSFGSYDASTANMSSTNDQPLVDGPAVNEIVNDLLITNESNFMDTSRGSLASDAATSNKSVDVSNANTESPDADMGNHPSDTTSGINASLNWLFNNNQSPETSAIKTSSGSPDAITANKSPGTNELPLQNAHQPCTETLDDLPATIGSPGICVDVSSTMLTTVICQIPDTIATSSSIDVAGLSSIKSGSPDASTANDQSDTTEHPNMLHGFLTAYGSHATDALSGSLNTNGLPDTSVPIDEFVSSDAKIEKTSPYINEQSLLDEPGNETLSDLIITTESAGKYALNGSLAPDAHPLPDATDVHVADTNSQLLLDAKESTGTEKLNGLPVTYITTDMDASHGIDQFFKLANTANHSTDTTEKLSSTITSNTLLHANSSHNDDVTKSHDTNYHPQLEAGTEILDDLLATNESSDTDTSRGLLASDIHQSPDATALTNPLDAVGLSNVNTESLDSERVKQSTDATTCKQTPHTNTSKRLLAANILPGVDTSNWSQNINPLLDSSASLRSIDSFGSYDASTANMSSTNDQPLVDGPAVNEIVNDLLITNESNFMDTSRGSLASDAATSNKSVDVSNANTESPDADMGNHPSDTTSGINASLNWLFNNNQSPETSAIKTSSGSPDAITANKSPGTNELPLQNAHQPCTETLDDLPATIGSPGLCVDVSSTMLTTVICQIPDTIATSSSIDVAGLSSIKSGSPDASTANDQSDTTEHPKMLHGFLSAYGSHATDALSGSLNTNGLPDTSVPIDEFVSSDAKIEKTSPYINEQSLLDEPGNETLSDLIITTESAGKYALNGSLAPDAHPLPDATVPSCSLYEARLTNVKNHFLDADAANHLSDTTEQYSDTNASSSGSHNIELLIHAFIFLSFLFILLRLQ